MTMREIEKEVTRAANESRAKRGALVDLVFPFTSGWKIQGYMMAHRNFNPTKACSLVGPDGTHYSTGAQSYAVSFFYWRVMKGGDSVQAG
jgi:hypothetical protein